MGAHLTVCRHQHAHRPKKRPTTGWAGSLHRLAVVAVGALTAAAVCVPHAAAEASPTGRPAPAEVITWGASADRMGEAVADRSYRLVARTSVGGSGLRIRLSNAFGDRPVTFGSAYAGLRESGAAVVRGSNRRLTFGGEKSVTVPPGEVVYSDPLPWKLPALASLVVSIHVTDAAGPATGHGMAMQTSYAAPGDHAAEEGADGWAEQIGSWFYLDAVTVRPATGIGAVVALGDSITDGWQSTGDLDRRWPDYLSRRLQAAGGVSVKGVANEGISGNKLLVDDAGQSALKRLDRDVLSHPGVRTVLLFEGVNDIKSSPVPSAQDMINGYREIISRVHADGRCVVGATVAPFKGWYEWTPGAEAIRRDVNEFIRNGGEFDEVADFDRVLRSPYDHERMLPFLDGGDHLHPNDKGMRAMADAVDLSALECDR